MNIIIRQWKLSDAADLANAISNLNVQNRLHDGIPYPYTENDGQQFISTMLASDKNDLFAFAIEYDGKVVGSVSAERQKNIHRKTAELGYYIAEEYWGKGIATQAVKLLCDYVFKNSDIIRIFAEVLAHNDASCKVLEKSGFQCEGTLRQSAVKCGKVTDVKVYALIR